MSNKDPDQALTPAERDRLLERHFETMVWRKWADEHNFRATLEAARRIGDRLKALKGR